ncbi:hypothetical protein PR003_g11077 [Phytophthora rubi]|uniref:Uncharacterized protein n=1 Tax=Phytophthora rubi TaxID=129364 RepID=A0A6A3P241_9STRA|nr:hypothetical protein PR001_g8949 [Phytophthora rubi]KAE9047207.1 hypothetical protein PR002_g1179 [Phytophthora rubi]KAE9339303.1 hypothetical protein PR003_g11077 [Phytophthora rubi]
MAWVGVASAWGKRKRSRNWRLVFPFCSAHSAGVARPLCKRNPPSICYDAATSQVLACKLCVAATPLSSQPSNIIKLLGGQVLRWAIT